MATGDYRDRAEIADLFNLYAFALDERRFDWLEDVFTEDGGVEFPGGYAVAGRAEAIELIAMFMEKCSATHHLMANHFAVVEGDAAQAKCYVRAHHARKGGEGVFEESLAVFTADCVRTEHGWRIKTLVEHIPIALGDFAALDSTPPPGVVLSGWAVSVPQG